MLAQTKMPGAAAIRTNDASHRMARNPEYARSTAADLRARYLWLDAGQSWPFLRGLETISNRALSAWLFVVAGCVCWAMIMMVAGGGTRPMEATVQMERLAEKLERTTEIPAETANARLIAQPWYDCGHAACGPELSARNQTARTRLENLLADKGSSNALDLSASERPRNATAEARH
jgi:hypothetical protein